MAFKTIGIFAALLTSTGFIPQIIKAFQTKQLKDLSLIMLLVIFFGTLLWVIYGISINDPIVIAANAFTCMLVAILLVTKKLYNGKG